MRNSTLSAVTASFAAVAMIVSVGTSDALARGGGGGGMGAFHGGGGFHSSGGFHSGGAWNGGFHRHSGYFGGYNACVLNPYNQFRNSTYPIRASGRRRLKARFESPTNCAPWPLAEWGLDCERAPPV